MHDVQVTAADVENGLIVEHDGNMGVLQQGLRGRQAGVGLNHGGKTYDGADQCR